MVAGDCGDLLCNTHQPAVSLPGRYEDPGAGLWHCYQLYGYACHAYVVYQKQISRKWMMFGALLFVISDSVLAINKFYQPFEEAG
jgi:hypothetical protein